MKLIGQQRMEKVATLMGKSKILTYGILPSFAWFFLSSPGALTMGKFLPERCKPAYQDALGSTGLTDAANPFANKSQSVSVAAGATLTAAQARPAKTACGQMNADAAPGPAAAPVR